MKKLLLITIILILQSFPSFGEWKKMYSKSDGVSFINTDTIMQNEGLIYYDLLTNYFEPKRIFDSTNTSLSYIVRSAINCKTKKFRGIRAVLYLDPMGNGKDLHIRHIDNDWFDLKGEGGYGPIYNFLCK